MLVLAMVTIQPMEGNQMNYTSGTGKRVIIEPVGKSFKSTTYYPATKHSPSETITKTHRTWAGVDKIIRNMERVQ